MTQTAAHVTAPGRGAVVLALRCYGRELLRLRRPALPALLLPAVGNIGIRYVAPLLVAKLAGQAADGGGLTVGSALPYVLGFGAVLLLAEAVWRVGQHCQQGSHSELLAADGAYARLWQHQSGGFLGENAAPAPDGDAPGEDLARQYS
ncbi:hypothetical protein AMK11_23510 [Streptomyces sp. CB02414]|nr:hypothetical protein AMK11_23510 [Streptomyces sp. CB02414]